MVERGGGADKQRIKLHQAIGVFFGNKFGMNTHFFGDLAEFFQRLLVTGRKLFFGIVKYGQAKTAGFIGTGLLPDPLTETIEGLGKGGLLLVVEFPQRESLHAFNLISGSCIESDFQNGTGIMFKNKTGYFFQAFFFAGAKVDNHAPGGLGRFVCLYPLIANSLQVLIHPDTGAAFEFIDDIYAGNHLMSSGLGQQRAVIAFGIVTVIVAQINNQLAALFAVFVLQVIQNSKQAVGLVVRGPVAEGIEQNQHIVVVHTNI